MDTIYDEFMSYMETSDKYSDIPIDIVEKYRNVFKGPKDNLDVIVDIWRKFGLNSYRNGLLWFVNPEEYNELARMFPNVSNEACVFARTASGCLFLWEKFSFGRSITHLNVHKGTNNVIGSNFDMLLEWNLSTTSFWERDCYGKIELKVIEKHGSIAYDECYTFVPALALGGSESIAKMQKVKIKEQLEILSQLY